MRYQLGDKILVNIVNEQTFERIPLVGHVREHGLAMPRRSGDSRYGSTTWMMDMSLGNCPVCVLPVIPMLEETAPTWTCRHNLPKSHPLFVRSPFGTIINDDEVTSLCPHQDDECPMMVCVHDACYDLLLGDSVVEVQSR